VVATGMHSMGWTREQAIQFFKGQHGEDGSGHYRRGGPLHCVARTKLWPYKLGQLKIRELRMAGRRNADDDFTSALS